MCSTRAVGEGGAVHPSISDCGTIFYVSSAVKCARLWMLIVFAKQFRSKCGSDSSKFDINLCGVHCFGTSLTQMSFSKCSGFFVVVRLMIFIPFRKCSAEFVVSLQNPSIIFGCKTKKVESIISF